MVFLALFYIVFDIGIIIKSRTLGDVPRSGAARKGRNTTRREGRGSKAKGLAFRMRKLPE